MLVIAGDRKKVEQEEIPEFFTPVTGKWGMKCESFPLRTVDFLGRWRADNINPIRTALTKVFADEESYNSGHGHAYEAFGVDPQRGALVVVRPDHCMLRERPLDSCPLNDCLVLLVTGADTSFLPSDVAKVASLDEADSIGEFFESFLVPASQS